jgi:hypothetical protein
MNCDETPSPKNCHPPLFFSFPASFQRPSAVCVLWLLFAFNKLSLLKVPDVKKNLIFMELGKFNPILLTERQEESFLCLRWSDATSTASLNLFHAYYLPAQLFLFYESTYLKINVSLQILQLTVHNVQLTVHYVHKIVQRSTYCRDLLKVKFLL